MAALIQKGMLSLSSLLSQLWCEGAREMTGTKEKDVAKEMQRKSL